MITIYVALVILFVLWVVSLYWLADARSRLNDLERQIKDARIEYQRRNTEWGFRMRDLAGELGYRWTNGGEARWIKIGGSDGS